MTRMTDPSRPGPDDAEDALPAALIEDLSALYQHVRVPPEVDARVLNGAAATWWRQARFRRRLWWGGAVAAAAAAVLLVVMVLPRSHGPVDRGSVAITGDVDHNGKVDILDAFSLARRIRDTKNTPLPVSREEA